MEKAKGIKLLFATRSCYSNDVIVRYYRFRWKPENLYRR